MDIDEFIKNPRENLSTELKSWIDIDDNKDKAKLIKTSIALRNNNGGYLLIGFDDSTCNPIKQCPFEDVEVKYHTDKIQSIITKFSSELFEVEVHYPKISNQTYVVIAIPSGFRSPVATKATLANNGGKPIVKQNTVYVRTLNSNNTPSTAEAGWKDWQDIAARCFDNREADIGRFVQRNLTPNNLKNLRELLFAEISPNSPQENKDSKIMEEFFSECEAYYESAIKDTNETLPQYGTWEVGVIIDGEAPKAQKANANFLNLIDSSNPRLTGWPVWVDSRSFYKKDSRPVINNKAWQAFIPSLDGGWTDQIDFLRIDPKGRLFLLRALQDDIGKSNRSPEPLTRLEFALSILRTAESIVVAIAFAKAMAYPSESTKLLFGFKWTKLKGRELSYWAHPQRHISGGKIAHQDTFYAEAEISLGATNTAICQHLYDVTNELFSLFNGFEIGYGVVEDLFNRLVSRKL